MYDATWLLRAHAGRRMRRLRRADAATVQLGVLRSLLRRAGRTRFARDHDLAGVRSLDGYRRRVPVRGYEEFWDGYWGKDFPSLVDCTWPGLIPWFAETSGTTRGATKYIPVSHAINRANRRAGADLLCWHLANRPKSRILAGRTFMLGGSTGLKPQARGVASGDLSGITASVMPGWARLRAFPPRELESISDWRLKIDVLARRSLGRDIRAIGGVPSWLLIYFDHLIEVAGVRDRRLAAVYPGLELVVHGGVAWEPYRERFAELLEGSGAETREVYPASEGFFAVADRDEGTGMRLLVDNGIFYEFAPVDRDGVATGDCRWIGDAEPGVAYALVVSTAAGLWRYVVGDTVTFVDLDPPRLLMTGRTAHTLSSFGEHVIGAELERSVAAAARAIAAPVTDFAVGSRFPASPGERGGHLYVVEFSSGPPGGERLAAFAGCLDETLQEINADYAAHRSGGWGMNPPEIEVLPPGGFAAWMGERGRLGGQNKVPRVIHDRDLLEDLRAFARRQA